MLGFARKFVSKLFLRAILSGSLACFFKLLKSGKNQKTKGPISPTRDQNEIPNALVLAPYGLCFNEDGKVQTTNVGPNAEKVLRRTIAYIGFYRFLRIYIAHILRMRELDVPRAFHLIPRHGYGPNKPNYCHWLLEDLPKLKNYSQIDSDGPIILNSVLTSFQTDSLEKLGHKANILPLPKNSLTVSKLRIPEMRSAGSKDGQPDSLRRIWMRDTLLSNASKAHFTSARVAIVRKNSDRRRLINQNEFDSLCAKFEIERLDPADYSISEQVDIFGKARLLIAVHGAGLANMVFMKTGCVVELSHNVISDRVFFESLANELELGYFRSVSDDWCETTTEQNDVTEFTADLEAVRNYLSENNDLFK